jgi:heme/copper-type cytochrome/quinol oxidase subunit 2
MIVRNSGVGKKFLGKDVIPTQGRDCVAPFHIGAVFVVIMIPIVLIIIVILVLTVVKTEKNPVLVRKLVVDFGVEVIEPIRKLAV